MNIPSTLARTMAEEYRAHGKLTPATARLLSSRTKFDISGPEFEQDSPDAYMFAQQLDEIADSIEGKLPPK